MSLSYRSPINAKTSARVKQAQYSTYVYLTILTSNLRKIESKPFYLSRRSLCTYFSTIQLPEAQVCTASGGTLCNGSLIVRNSYTQTSCLMSQTSLSRLQNYCLDLIMKYSSCAPDGCYALLISLRQFELITEMSHVIQD